MDTDSPELMAPRNSRYEVTDQILADLTKAIPDLPIEQSIPAEEKGRVSQWAAKAFKARVLLYEATWRKYNGTSTDFEGSKGPEKDQINEFLDEAILLSEDVINNGGYRIWNQNSNGSIPNQSSYYLFNLEDAGSNPAGLTKESNNEFILYGVYDVVLRPGNINLSHTVGQMYPSRKMIDMYLCKDGLPIEYSTLFQGYHNTGDEYKNRDYRLKNYTNQGNDITSGSVKLTTGLPGYGCSKFYSYNYPDYRREKEESANYPVLRLAEVYLNYAEACVGYGEAEYVQKGMEMLNLIRQRAGIDPVLTSWAKAKHPFTSYAAALQSGQLMEVVKRERMIELYMEGHNFWDLRRWKMAEEYLNKKQRGLNVEGVNEESLLQVVSINQPREFISPTNYLMPIPNMQVSSNPQMVQNPGY